MPLIRSNPSDFNAKVHIIGIGTSGQFAVDHFLKNQLFPEAHYTVMNTNSKFLRHFTDTHNIVLGAETLRGQGTGGSTKLGKQAIDESRIEIEEYMYKLQDDIVIILGGVGRGTGSTAIPVISQIARKNDAVVLTFLRTPFKFEGARINEIAENALEKIKEFSHGTVVLPNQYLIDQDDGEAPFYQTMQRGNEIMADMVTSVLGIISEHGMINIDFNDLKNLAFNSTGGLYIGSGRGEGERFVEDALLQVVMNPLVKDKLDKPKNMILKLKISSSVPMEFLDKVMNYLGDFTDGDGSVKVGTVIDPSFGREELEVALVAGR